MKKALSIVSAPLVMVAGLLLSASAFAAAPAQQAAKPETVFKILESRKDLSKFKDMIESAGIEKDFDSKGAMITVFAPTNAAMEKIPSDVMKRAKSEKDNLKSFVRYHTIMGSAVFAGNIKNRMASPSSGSGEMIGFDGRGKELKVNDGVITTPDLVALNGVVHIVDAPMIPPSFKGDKDKKKEEEAERAKMEEMTKERAATPAAKAEKGPTAPQAPTAPSVPEAAAPSAVAPAAPAPEKKGFLKKLFGG